MRVLGTKHGSSVTTASLNHQLISSAPCQAFVRSVSYETLIYFLTLDNLYTRYRGPGTLEERSVSSFRDPRIQGDTSFLYPPSGSRRSENHFQLRDFTFTVLGRGYNHPKYWKMSTRGGNWP